MIPPKNIFTLLDKFIRPFVTYFQKINKNIFTNLVKIPVMHVIYLFYPILSAIKMSSAISISESNVINKPVISS